MVTAAVMFRFHVHSNAAFRGFILTVLNYVSSLRPRVNAPEWTSRCFKGHFTRTSALLSAGGQLTLGNVVLAVNAASWQINK